MSILKEKENTIEERDRMTKRQEDKEVNELIDKEIRNK
jgi:hypothetical protein